MNDDPIEGLWLAPGVEAPNVWLQAREPVAKRFLVVDPYTGWALPFVVATLVRKGLLEQYCHHVAHPDFPMVMARSDGTTYEVPWRFTQIREGFAGRPKLITSILAVDFDLVEARTGWVVAEVRQDRPYDWGILEVRNGDYGLSPRGLADLQDQVRALGRDPDSAATRP